jgi:hypothetical protein
MINVAFVYDGITENKMLPYEANIDKTQQFDEYIHRIPYLFPLRFLASEAKKEISRIKRGRITRLVPGDLVYLNLRYFDGDSSAWFDSLDLPEKDKSYFAQVRVLRWTNNRHNEVEGRCNVFNCNVTLNNYDVQAVILTEQEFIDDRDILVTEAFRVQYPKMFEY